MTQEELIELRDWSARKIMGWFYCGTEDGITTFSKKEEYEGKMYDKIFSLDWKPDLPETGQIWMLLKILSKESFSKRLAFIRELERIIAGRYPELNKDQRISGLWSLFFITPMDILLAAKATEEE